MVLKKGRNWNLPEQRVISESRYFNRREFLKKLGYSAAGAGGLATALTSGCAEKQTSKDDNSTNIIDASVPDWIDQLYPAETNPDFDEVPQGRVMTPQETAGTYNNFYEFGVGKTKVHINARSLVTRPWAVEIGGLVHNPVTLDVDDMYRLLDLEERIYSMRCVEAWSMVVPWTGFPMSKLLDLVQPMQKAKYVNMIAFYRPKEAVGQRELTHYAWPYYEALTLAEAYNELTMLVTGIFGYLMPSQFGAPFRLITPWKYGYKSIKSIVKIELTETRPSTFWSDINSDEYDFTSNVDPAVPHPRWSQATERDIGINEKIETLPYNGYGEWVAHLYE